MTNRNTKRRPNAMPEVLRFTFAHWKKQRLRAWVMVLAITAATVTEVFIPTFAGRLVDALAQDNRAAVMPAFAAMAALGFALIILRHTAWMNTITFTLRLMADIGADAFRRVQRFSTDWHANTFAGSTVRKITRGMWALDLMNDTLLLALAPSLVMLLGTIVILGLKAPLLGAVMGVGAVIYVSFTVVMATQWLAPAASLSNAWDTRMSGLLADSISSNAVVKSFGAELREETRLDRLLFRWAGRTRRTWTRGTLAGTIQIALLWVVRTALVGAALWLWSHGQATPGDVAFVITSYFIVNGYFRDIGQHINHLQRSVNEMEELVAIHAQPLGIEDRPTAAPVRLSGEVRFDDVTFRYGSHTTPLYSNLAVTIPRGQRVGLVGHSGSGKTTFVKLIQRLYDVTDGRVLIDGHDVRDVTQASLRSQIAVVQQEPILFHRSLAENIAYGKPGASEAEIVHAAKLANAHDFIAKLPRGYATLVGERGVKLSGGERQRVALARAFLADAPILILDEATSSLDSESEALIQEAITRLLRGRTALVIAHRLSTVRALDRILVFDQGRIVQDGTHEQLLDREGGMYRRLFDRQAGGFTPRVVA